MNKIDDTISRKTAIDALDEIESEVADGYGYQYEKWRKYFCGLPSAQPEPKQGKWKTAYLDHVSMGIRPKVLYCSECNQCIAYPTNFCPNCGAEMENEVTE